MIAPTEIDRIKTDTDCRDLIAAALGEPTKRSGENTFWLCPWHTETDGSFSATKDFYHCFGCQESGDQIDFIMTYYSKSFRDALIQLNHGHAPDQQLTKEQSLEYALQKAERYKKQLDAAGRRYKIAIDELRALEVDLQFYRQVDRELWHDRYGMTDWGIDYYRLGYCLDFCYTDRGIPHTSDTLTIPFYQPATNYNLVNLRHRLLQPNGAGKYRPHKKGLGQPLFYGNLNRGNMPNAVIVEGGIKAAKLWETILHNFMNADDTESAWLVNNVQVIGMPGSSISQNNLAVLDEPETIWLFMDPDAYRPNVQFGKIKPSKADLLADKLGTQKCRLVELPGKPDDLIVEGVLKTRDIYWLMKNARRSTIGG